MKQTLIRSTILIFILALIAKLIGFAKSMVMAAYFGAGMDADAYYFANGLVANILYMITTSVGISFLPVYIRIREERGRGEARGYAGETLCILSAAAIALTIVVIATAPWFIHLVAPSYEGVQLENTVLFLRIMSLGVIFSLLTNIYSNLLNAEKVYGFSNLTSIINSIVLIIVVVAGSGKYGIIAAVVAVPLSFLIQWVMLSTRGKKYVRLRPRRNPWNLDTKVLISQAMPILFSNATIELNQLVDRILLVGIAEGAVTANSYAAVLFQFAGSLLAVPIGTVAFTEFSEKAAKGDYEGMRILLKRALHAMFLVGIPVTAVMVFFATPIVDIVFGHGRYTDSAVAQTALCLVFYSFCVIPVCIKQVMTKAFYSLGDTRLPMILSISEVVLNTVLSIVLARYAGIAGVVAGTAIATATFAVVQIAIFSKKKIPLCLSNNGRAILKLMIGTALAFILAWYLHTLPNQTPALFFIYAFAVMGFFFLFMLALRDSMMILGINKVKRKMLR